MNKLWKYLVLSFALHLALIFTLMTGHYSDKQRGVSYVYEVSLLSGMPMETLPSSSEQASFSAPMQEMLPEEITPELASYDINTETQAENKKAQQPGMPTHVLFGAGGQLADESTGNSSLAVKLWRTRIWYIVNTLRKSPLELSITDKSLKNTCLLRVSRDGQLLQKQLLVSSGNTQFDRSVIMALNRIIRLPPPPNELIAEYDWVEIIIIYSPSI